MAIRNENMGGTDWSNGDILKAVDLNDTFDNTVAGVDETNIFFRASPIGAVIAWLKDYTNTPSLPSSWVECNGQTLDDEESVYDGQTIPDLNGGNRFLRGSSSSGTTGGSDTHNHTVNKTYDDFNTAGSNALTNITLDAASSLPKYYEVVWIMRVK
jgi:hypothetical protein